MFNCWVMTQLPAVLCPRRPPCACIAIAQLHSSAQRCRQCCMYSIILRMIDYSAWASMLLCLELYIKGCSKSVLDVSNVSTQPLLDVCVLFPITMIHYILSTECIKATA